MDNCEFSTIPPGSSDGTNTHNIEIVGPKGDPGPAGPAGADGAAGPAGPQGPQGLSVIRIYRKVDHNDPRPATPDADGFDPSQPVGSRVAGITPGWTESPPTFNPANDDTFYESFFIWDPADDTVTDCSVPLEVGAELGAQGPQGDRGERGPAGARGPAGPQGVQGDRGPAGADGADGADGARGPAGAQGPVGPEGPQGTPGLPGAQGERGPQGDQGPIGPEGPAGPSGGLGAASTLATLGASDLANLDALPLFDNSDGDTVKKTRLSSLAEAHFRNAGTQTTSNDSDKNPGI